MATYRCIQSGNFVTFTLPHDIESMKGHQGYVRIDEVETEEAVKPLILKQPVRVKKMGRPRKLANV
jgi:transcriptional regulator CtsR